MTDADLPEAQKLDFLTFFRKASGRTPYPYQCRLACGGEARLDTPLALMKGTQCKSSLINIPTGLGKTAAVTLGWIWNRVACLDNTHRATWPRRLVYCLPMRTLVEQTREVVSGWIKNLSLENTIAVSILMGGEDTDRWDLYPEREAILIGTQDMLLSRALNRGYGMNRYRWPMQFGLLNSDCLWVFDEVQLMGSGLATTTQLESFRNGKQNLGAQSPVRSFWMSATLETEWLKTVDFDPASLDRPIKLESEDRVGNEAVNRRCGARKLLRPAESSSGDYKRLASEIANAHRGGTLTLAVVNTVQRARQLYSAIKLLQPGGDLLLIHSRFRPGDRKEKIRTLMGPVPEAGRIVVSTQVVEAGVDISARTLFTELAPWISLIQRFGRCNRSGEFKSPDEGQVFWVDVTSDDRSARPYSAAELDVARAQLKSLHEKSVSPDSLDSQQVATRHRHNHVIRRKDVVDLFDTTPDLAGNDIDIDRYVRDVHDSDVRVFWRNLGGIPPNADEPLPSRAELCPVPIGGPNGFQQFDKKLRQATHLKLRKTYRRNYLGRLWEAVNTSEMYPGQVYMVDQAVGGYDSETGWTGEVSRKNAEPVAVVSSDDLASEADDGNDADPSSHIPVWQTIAQHTDEVCHELELILRELNLTETESLKIAGRWHDWGKVHEVFQGAIRDEHSILGPRPASWIGRRDIGKAPGRQVSANGIDPGWWTTYKRPRFRHELASAMAVMQLDSRLIDERIRGFVAYLVAAHHGKVRLSIRSLPGERQPERSQRFARGIWEGDLLPEVNLGGGVTAPATVICLETMELGNSSEGRPSWTETALSVRDDIGVFRLAYFEAILRSADMRASQEAKEEVAIFSVGEVRHR